MTKLSLIGRAVAILLLALLATPQATAQVVVTTEVSAEQTPAGSNVVIAIILDHEFGWHSWPAEDQDALPEDLAENVIHTKIEFGETPSQVEAFFPIQWPEPHDSPVSNPAGVPPVIDLPTYSDRAIAYISFKVADDATSTFTVPFTVTYQTCDDSTCLPPEDVTFDVEITVGDLSGDRLGTGDFAAFDAAVFDDAPIDLAKIAKDSENDEASAKGLGGLFLLILLSAIGGFVLNLTPCVLPIIPLKIMAMSKHAETPGKAMYLALWMAAGVVAFWTAIGLPMAIFAGVFDPSRLFGIWWFTGTIGLIIALMAVGIMGAFTINLPQSAYMFNPKADTAWGSFLFGVMTAVLGLPCFGFVAGALLVGVAMLPFVVIITIFTALGAGMASPYLVLAAKPKWIEKIPRTGPASELVKQIMGLLLLVASVYFLGAGVLALIGVVGLPWWGTQVHVWLMGLIGLAAGGWLVFRTFQITKSASRRVIFAFFALLISGSAVAYAAHSTEKAYNNIWIDFSQEALEQAIAEGNVVVVDFTAEWCLTCKALEMRVLDPDPVHSKLLETHVVPLVADVTSDDAIGWDKLTDIGRVGIPYLAIFAGDADQPFWAANRYTKKQVMDAIKRAEESLGITAESTALADSDGP